MYDYHTYTVNIGNLAPYSKFRSDDVNPGTAEFV